MRTNAKATLSIAAGVFTDTNGTGAGASYGEILVGDGATLDVGGTFVNHGTVALAGVSSAATLAIAAGGATFRGGHIQLSNEAGNEIVGYASVSQAVSTLTNGGVISGAGTIGADLAIVNSGIIDANTTTALTVTPGNSAELSAGTIVNTGTLEATGGGTLALTGGNSPTTALNINDTGGVIEASGAGSHVDLTGVTLSGGALETYMGGVINITGTDLYRLEYPGITVRLINKGTMNIAIVDLNLNGGVSNSGTLNLESSLGRLHGNTTLSGHGTVNLVTYSLNETYIFADKGLSGATLTNLNNTIQGAGVIGVLFQNNYDYGGINLINGASGVIDANRQSTRYQALSLVEDKTTITNQGLIEASAGARLDITVASNQAAGTVYNSGLIEDNGGALLIADYVVGSGSIRLQNSGTLETAVPMGETITFADGTGELRVEDLSGAAIGTLSGFSATGGAEIRIDALKFTNSAEASFSGNATSGVLTVSDGTNTFSFTLLGDYLGATFVTTSTGFYKGVIIKATTPAAPTNAGSPVSSPHALIAAMASLGTPSGALIPGADSHVFQSPLLFKPGASTS